MFLLHKKWAVLVCAQLCFALCQGDDNQPSVSGQAVAFGAVAVLGASLCAYYMMMYSKSTLELSSSIALRQPLSREEINRHLYHDIAEYIKNQPLTSHDRNRFIDQVRCTFWTTYNREKKQFFDITEYALFLQSIIDTELEELKKNEQSSLFYESCQDYMNILEIRQQIAAIECLMNGEDSEMRYDLDGCRQALRAQIDALENSIKNANSGMSKA